MNYDCEKPTSNQIKFIRNHPILLGRVVFMKDERGPIVYAGQNDSDDLDVIGLKGQLELFGIEYENLSIFNYPCFNETCDLFVFDWGGMSLMANGGELLEKFSRQLVKSASENFNRKYLIYSEFSEYAIKDAMEEFGEDKPNNIFLRVADLRKELDIEQGNFFSN